MMGPKPRRCSTSGVCVVLADVLLRAALTGLYLLLQSSPTFTREVQVQDWHKYNFPHVPHDEVRVSSRGLALLVIGGYLVISATCLVVTWVRWRFSNSPSSKLLCLAEDSGGCGPSSSGVTLFDTSEAAVAANVHDYPDWRGFVVFCIKQQWRLFLAASLALLYTGIITCFLKHLVGRPRPDFLARCAPEAFDRLQPDFSLLPSIPVCRSTSVLAKSGYENDYEIFDGRRSFPSGHSSYSFAISVFGALFTYYYLFADVTRKEPAAESGPVRFFLRKRRGSNSNSSSHKTEVAKAAVLSVCLLALLPAVYVAASRTMDYVHHYEDVLVGALLGTALAFVGFASYYPISKFRPPLELFLSPNSWGPGSLPLMSSQDDINSGDAHSSRAYSSARVPSPVENRQRADAVGVPIAALPPPECAAARRNMNLLDSATEWYYAGVREAIQK